MILDFKHSQTPTNLKSKICIVGSGVMGLSLISEFLRDKKTDILLVDSGADQENKDLNSLDEVLNCGDVESGVEGSRTRVFGGASTLWGGQALPLGKLDLQQKDWVQNSGWPLKHEQLLPYYQRAARFLSLDDADFEKDIWDKGIPFQQQVNSQLLNLSHSKWSPSANLAKIYNKPIERAEHISMLFNATVTQVVLDDSLARVDKLIIKNLDGKQGEISADIFILCCGGIDNARVLLASNSQLSNGVGNQRGNVGLYYQDHIGIYGAQLIPRDFAAFQHMFSNVLVGKQKYLPKLALSESLQINETLLHVNGNIACQSDDDSPFTHLKNAYSNLRSNGLGREAIRSIIKASSTPVQLLRILDSYYIKHRKYFPKDARFFLIANCETEPTATSSLALSSQTDALGMPKAKINWKLTELSKRSLRVYYEAVKTELDRLGVAQTIIKPQLLDSSEQWKSHCYSLYHHMGSTRMSESPDTGVVDNQCKLFGVSNLFVSGSSIFPTSSASNPTFTAIALAIRLADHIKKNKLREPLNKSG